MFSNFGLTYDWSPKNQTTKPSTVVYLDQLLGAVRTQKRKKDNFKVSPQGVD